MESVEIVVTKEFFLVICGFSAISKIFSSQCHLYFSLICPKHFCNDFTFLYKKLSVQSIFQQFHSISKCCSYRICFFLLSSCKRASSAKMEWTREENVQQILFFILLTNSNNAFPNTKIRKELDRLPKTHHHHPNRRH